MLASDAGYRDDPERDIRSRAARLFPSREIVTEDNGKAIVRIVPESDDVRGLAFVSRIAIQDGTP